MDRPDGFAAAVPSNGDPREGAGLNVIGNHKHWSTASLHDGIGYRHRMGFGWPLPFVLAQDHQVRIMGVRIDFVRDVADGFIPTGLQREIRGLPTKDRRRRLRVGYQFG
jgi:hypothetical protein